MEQIPVRVLNQDTASVLAKVEQGQTVEITSRGRAVARISPVPGPEREIDDLVAAGWVIPATNRAPFTMPPGPVDTDNSASAALIAMRDEERW